MELQEAVTQFLFHCRYEKNLSPKTLKAYSIDLRQFTEYLATNLEIATLAAGRFCLAACALWDWRGLYSNPSLRVALNSHTPYPLTYNPGWRLAPKRLQHPELGDRLRGVG